MVEVPHLCGVFIRLAVFVLFVSATFVVHQKENYVGSRKC